MTPKRTHAQKSPPGNETKSGGGTKSVGGKTASRKSPAKPPASPPAAQKVRRRAQPKKGRFLARVDGETPAERKKRARRISNALRKIHGRRGTALKFQNPFQLLVAVVLSAQSTDDQVNKATPALFAKFPDPASLAAARPAEVEKLIHSTGFYRQKARSIMKLSRDLAEKFGGRVPESMDALTSLAGVGRKTANCVRGMGFGRPAVIVDTHFKRLTQRMGLVEADDPTKIEFAVAELLPESHWTEFSNAMIWHGRGRCTARKPDCAHCEVLRDCPTGRANVD